jgi:hypothetical protein
VWRAGFGTAAAATALTTATAIVVYAAALWVLGVGEVKRLREFLRR